MEMIMTIYLIEVGGKYGKFNKRFLCLEVWTGNLTMRDMEFDDKACVIREWQDGMHGVIDEIMT